MFTYNIELWIFNILTLFNFGLTFNVEELKWVNYEVDISMSPVKKEEVIHPIVHIMSRSGQEFQCVLPQLNEEEFMEKEVINDKEDVIELLKPMKSGSCLSKGKDWWTYEFCFGHYIKQYHVEDGHIIGQVITLGLYESDYDWNNETDQEKFKHVKQRYHSQYYANGTKCDLTGQPRNAEVRIYCEEDAGDYIYRVDEPGTCSYIITVHTSRLCSHPQLKPLPSNKAHLIPCHPLLNDEQYSSYLQKLKEEKALAEEKRNQWLTDQQERLQVMKNENIQVEGNIEKAPSGNNKITSLNKNEFVRTFLLQEYDKEIGKLKSSVPPEKFDSVKTDMQRRFVKALDEAGEYLETELSDDSKDITVSEVTSLLNMLMEKLEKAEKDVVQATEELNKARSVVSDVHTSDSDEKLLDSMKDDTKETKKIVQENSDEKLLDSMKDDTKETKKIVQENNLNINSDSNKVSLADSDTQTGSAVLDDDKLQVRIRRLDRKSSGKLHEMDFEQRKKLEQVVKERLEKAGLDTGGRRIEVKIITAGYYDNEEGKDFQSLTDEETDQFQNMIMALLAGQQEAVQEMKRHQKLEESYKFMWNENEEIDSKED